jgi:branched-chain amino acid transport system permease protein
MEAFPFYMQVFSNGFVLSCYYILIALGLNLIMGIMHIVNFAQGTVYMLSAMLLYILCVELGLHYILAGAPSIVATALLGILMERFLFRRLLGQFLPSLVMSLGLLLAIEGAVWLRFGIISKAIPTVFRGTFSVLGAFVSYERLVVIIGSLLLIGGLFVFIRHTKAGKAIRAVEQNREAAILHGIEISAICRLVFTVSFGLSAAAAFLVSPMLVIDPNIGHTPLLKGLVIIVLGGMGSVTGTLAGGFIIGFIESTVSSLFDPTIASIASFVILMAILLVRPSGLFPYRM